MVKTKKYKIKIIINYNLYHVFLSIFMVSQKFCIPYYGIFMIVPFFFLKEITIITLIEKTSKNYQITNICKEN